MAFYACSVTVGMIKIACIMQIDLLIVADCGRAHKRSTATYLPFSLHNMIVAIKMLVLNLSSVKPTCIHMKRECSPYSAKLLWQSKLVVACLPLLLHWAIIQCAIYDQQLIQSRWNMQACCCFCPFFSHQQSGAITLDSSLDSSKIVINDSLFKG